MAKATTPRTLEIRAIGVATCGGRAIMDAGCAFADSWSSGRLNSSVFSLTDFANFLKFISNFCSVEATRDQLSALMGKSGKCTCRGVVNVVELVSVCNFGDGYSAWRTGRFTA